MSATTPPALTASAVVVSGLPERATRAALVIGPTGLAYESGTLYVPNPLSNAIVAIPNALATSGGIASKLTFGRLLHGPLGMAIAPNGDPLVANGLNGDLVEITTSGHQVAEKSVDPDPAQSPPGSGDLFGLAVAPGGSGIYFGKDDTNTLALLH